VYLEIQELIKFVDKNACQCDVLSLSESSFLRLVPVLFTINNKCCTLYIDDEYSDVSHKNTLLNTELCLRALEDLDTSTDFLSWCNEVQLNPNNPKLLEYYKTATQFCAQISACFKNNKVASFVSDLDFSLNAGAAHYLRKL
jgi:hypothetical protein